MVSLKEAYVIHHLTKVYHSHTKLLFLRQIVLPPHGPRGGTRQLAQGWRQWQGRQNACKKQYRIDLRPKCL